jgi:hypothetical protein
MLAWGVDKKSRYGYDSAKHHGVAQEEVTWCDSGLSARTGVYHELDLDLKPSFLTTLEISRSQFNLHHSLTRKLKAVLRWHPAHISHGAPSSGLCPILVEQSSMVTLSMHVHRNGSRISGVFLQKSSENILFAQCSHMCFSNVHIHSAYVFPA